MARDHRGDQCNRWVVTAYKFERTHLLVVEYRPDAANVLSSLGLALDLVQEGAAGAEAARLIAARAAEARPMYHLADDPPNVPVVVAPGVHPPLFPWIDIGCPNHGIVREWLENLRHLLKQAKKDPARRKVELDVQSGAWRVP